MNRLATALISILLTGALWGPSQAQEEPDEEEPETIEGLDSLAEAIVWMTGPRWEGRRTSPPRVVERPTGGYRVDSCLQPLSVHADPQIPIAKAETALALLEHAANHLRAQGWGAPMADGGRGDTVGFDLYLVPHDALAEAHSDGLAKWSYLDAASSFAIVDPALAGVDLEAAIISAYTQALALTADPAEPRTWRRATGAWMAWRITGAFGPADSVWRQQQESHRSWVSTAAGDGEGGALFLAMASERHDGGSGDFVRGVWQLTRQRTWDGTDLRADPDLWQSFDAAVEIAGDKLHSMIEDFAVARWFMGTREANTEFQALNGLGSGGTIAPAFETDLASMPVHTPAGKPLEPFGSAYATVDVRGAPPASRLRVWLRGEYGVEWALTASRIDTNGRELARLSAPPRRGDRRSYLPVELTPDTTHVMVSVTNLSHRLPDADDDDPNTRAYRLIFDLVQD